MKRIFTYLIAFFVSSALYAQQEMDSLQRLEPVTIKAYFSRQPLLSIPSSAFSINQSMIEEKAVNSLLPVLNAVSGVRMEERSPGSYRLSIRGSLLRSPFGVRNVKIYFDGFPLTDAGGNAYLNLVGQTGIRNIEILKGPDGSIFGANSGGVVMIESMNDRDETNVGIKGGTYGFFNQNIGLQRQGKVRYAINEEYQRADGYRDHSFMERKYIQTQEKYTYGDNNELKFSGFYSDIQYQTPGGLTLAQSQANPKASRPATPATPSAIAQKAAIYNQTFFGGVANELQIRPGFKNVTGISGILTDYKNPFITNFETRKEDNLAVRTYFELRNAETHPVNMQAYLGWEFQHNSADIINYTNNQGVKGTVMAADRLKGTQQFVFSRLSMQAGEHFKAEAALSLNFFGYKFESLPQSITFVTGSKTFEEKLMPRFALSYLNENFALRATLSRGYSPPTIAEVRASDARINPDIEAENGWNFEVGFRVKDNQERLYADISTFNYRLNNAIVRRVNDKDQDFFVNAGGTKQQGIEIQLAYQLIKNNSGFLRNVILNNGLTINDFSFSDYQVGKVVYSGNDITGVPDANISSSLSLDFPKRFSLYIQDQYTSRLPVNDANTAYAESYHLLGLKAGWQISSKKTILQINAGADNLLNEHYSLGNDLNAVGNRYFNPAPLRNYYLSLRLKR
jgi:iron complex outermembrane receptor protein